MENLQIWDVVVNNSIPANSSKGYGLNGGSISNFYSWCITGTDSSSAVNLTLTVTGWGSGGGPLFTVTNPTSSAQNFNVKGLVVYGSTEDAANFANHKVVALD